jgi:hypothetical protein
MKSTAKKAKPMQNLRMGKQFILILKEYQSRQVAKAIDTSQVLFPAKSSFTKEEYNTDVGLSAAALLKNKNERFQKSAGKGQTKYGRLMSKGFNKVNLT